MTFLEHGATPVYIGFGSMPSSAEKTLAIVLKALEIANKRGCRMGWLGEGKGTA
jgi:UDP:flavonoid glycosyltransferase YjiC (YdhE family)